MAPASSRLRPLDNSVSTPRHTVSSNRVFASASFLDAAGGLLLAIPSSAGDDAEDGAIFLLIWRRLLRSSTLFLVGFSLYRSVGVVITPLALWTIFLSRITELDLISKF
mmetsp:Transcript_34712/g.77901  ORF Transcript_34712/g.77901 Transcript_34712/m.77901 type:complete len:109 (-) Transcript_34712:238-564(-)